MGNLQMFVNIIISNEDGHFSDYDIPKQSSISHLGVSVMIQHLRFQKQSFLPNKDFGDKNDKIRKQELSILHNRSVREF